MIGPQLNIVDQYLEFGDYKGETLLFNFTEIVYVVETSLWF